MKLTLFLPRDAMQVKGRSARVRNGAVRNGVSMNVHSR